ncbi:MAG: virulence RhuM family protein [Planctomycetota bacterium]|nr:virulence RhuM family protein [Planctomycetota bacterium]
MSDDANLPAPQGQFLIYADGASQLQVRLEGNTVWLTQKLIAELYGVSVKTVNEHLVNIYAEAELPPEATIRNFRIVQREGTRDVSRNVEHYSLDAILAVGYRVRSARGTAFRQWATARLSELLVKGFTMDDQRLKEGRTLGTDYFDELLARIRDIRSSERMFHQKILDIYATSIDYDPRAEASSLFFQTVQNKMHWAAHGHTAAEVVAARADADKPHMGLTTWKNAPAGPVRKPDVSIAKNYLDEEELDILNRIVSLYLEYAELQAKSKRPMHMAAWIAKLEDFLKSTDRPILTHAGKVSHETARLKAEAEFEKYCATQAALPQPVDQHFQDAIDELKKIEGEVKKTPKRPKRRKEKDE